MMYVYLLPYTVTFPLFIIMLEICYDQECILVSGVELEESEQIFFMKY